VRDLRDGFVLLDAAVLGDAGLPRRGGQLPDRLLVGCGDHPAAGEEEFPPRRAQRQQVLDELVAGPGAAGADQDLPPEPGGDLPEGRGRQVPVIGEGARSGVAGAQQHGQALARIGSPRRQRVEAVAFQVGAAPSLSECAVTRVASMSMTTQPASAFPAMTSHGNPAGVSWISFRACARALARARAIRSSIAGEPARCSARRTVGPLGASPAPGRGGRQRDAAHAGGAQHDRGRHRDQHDPPVKQGRRARLPQSGAQARCQPCLVGGLPQQDRARVADQARPAAGDLQGMVPPVMLHGEERSSPGNCMVW
jgi:hypothetical protein